MLSSPKKGKKFSLQHQNGENFALLLTNDDSKVAINQRYAIIC